MLSTRIALVVLALCLAVIGDSAAKSQKQPRAQAPQAQQSTQPNQRSTPDQPFSVNVIPTTEQKEYTENKDREAAIKTADDHKLVEYAWYQVLIGVVTFFIFVLQLVAFTAQARRLRQTIDLMKDTTERQLRAYVFPNLC
jgi:hypothetical protein